MQREEVGWLLKYFQFLEGREVRVDAFPMRKRAASAGAGPGAGGASGGAERGGPSEAAGGAGWTAFPDTSVLEASRGLPWPFRLRGRVGCRPRRRVTRRQGEGEGGGWWVVVAGREGVAGGGAGSDRAWPHGAPLSAVGLGSSPPVTIPLVEDAFLAGGR